MPKHAARRVVPRWFAVPDDGSQAVYKSESRKAIVILLMKGD